ncbi:MAG: helix-turn-helix transcriptional regulator [Clostridia bacterium]|nr:helix-turn-helix transcriptional regulator [Clostridia bacterium]
MELNAQIKKYRTEMNLSQDELAEKVYVTRQTVSNWENGKTYPDIHSLLLLSSLFNVSLDQLIKGDIETMKKEVNKAEVKNLNRYSAVYAVFLVATIIFAVPFFKWFGLYGIIPELLLFGCGLFFALKVEKIKKSNNIHTYKEIIAFTEGKMLDEIDQKVEVGKRPYQYVLLALGSAAVTALVCLLINWLLF